MSQANLITSYNLNPKAAQQKNSQTKNKVASKTVTPAQIKQVPAKPRAPKGRLVNGSLLDAPGILVNDTMYDLKAIKKGWQGDSNDHQLGKVNDMGMKIGGLGIAAYLFSKRPFATTKAMEFIGWGSFFGSMALWPKIAIEFPAYLVHGFNVQKRYVDSYGRKKPVFQDPQYIPWDLYSDKAINKIGNRLGVPKNIKNRREVVQDKMRKIATQNNTLWMLTAGFATPIMSALICNQAERLANKVQSSYEANKATSNFKDMKKGIGKYIVNPDIQDKNVLIHNKKELTDFIKEYANNAKNPLDEAACEKLAKIINPTNVLPTAFTDHLIKLFGVDQVENFEEEDDELADKVKKEKVGVILDNEKINKIKQINQTVANYNDAVGKIDKYVGTQTAQDQGTVLANACNEVKDKLTGILGLSKKDVAASRLDHFVASEHLRNRLEQIASNDEEYEKTLTTLAKEVRKFDNKFKQKDDKVVNDCTDGVFRHFAKKFGELGMNDTAQALFGSEKSDSGSIRFNVKSNYAERIQGVRGSFYNIIHELDLYRRIAKAEQNPSALGPIADKTIPLCTKEELLELAKTSVGFHSADYETRFFARRKNTTDKENVSYGDVKVQNGKIIDHETGKEYKSLENNRTSEINFDQKFYKNEMDILLNSGFDPTTEKVLNKKGINLLDSLFDFHTSLYNAYGSTPPETQELLTLTDTGFVNEMVGGHYGEIIGNRNEGGILDGCKSFEDLHNLLKAYNNNISISGYADIPAKDIMRKAGISPNVRTIDDFKAYIKSIKEQQLSSKYMDGYRSTAASRFTKIGQTFDECINRVSQSKFNSGKWLKTFTKAGAILLGVTVAAQFLFGGKTEAEKAQKTDKKNMKVKEG